MIGRTIKAERTSFVVEEEEGKLILKIDALNLNEVADTKSVSE